MQTSQEWASPQSAMLRKILRLLEGLRGNDTGKLLHSQIQRLLEEHESEQQMLEQLLTASLALLLDALSTHLGDDSALHRRLSLLRMHLVPPLTPSEIQNLSREIEACADEITSLPRLAEKDLESVLAGLSRGFGLTAGGVGERLGKQADESAPPAPLQPAPALTRERESHTPAMTDETVSRQSLGRVMAQAEALRLILDAELPAIHSAKDEADVEHRKFLVLREMEKLQRFQYELSDEIERANQALHQAREDSERLSREVNRVTQLSLTDELTRLPNRRAFLQRLEDEVSRVQRYGHGLALAFIDLDSFKEINDTYGHHAGDSVLTLYAQEVLSGFRQHDMVARWGGEEFAVILPNTTCQGAIRALKKVQATAARLHFNADGRSIPLPTFSAGLVIYQEGESVKDLLARADEGLYRAKGGGRNRIELIAAEERLSDVP